MMVYTDNLDGITADHLRGGFFAGWSSPLTPETHLRALRGADAVVLAVDDETDAVVGYITLLTDGVLSAFIPNIEVLSAYHGRGIGSELMRRMLEFVARIPNVDLLCDPDVQPFYARFGMQPCGGMVLRKRNLDINS